LPEKVTLYILLTGEEKNLIARKPCPMECKILKIKTFIDSYPAGIIIVK
jgi:hypothetical protein